MNGSEPQNATSMLGPNHFVAEGNTGVMYQIWHDSIQTGSYILVFIKRTGVRHKHCTMMHSKGFKNSAWQGQQQCVETERQASNP
jgi:hypothetical protein